MLCGRCQERPATMHLTKIVGGAKTEYHLCEQCAKEQGELFSKAAHAFDFTNLLSGLLNMESPPGYKQPQHIAARCEHCGMSYTQFTKLGRFGCPKCYDSFDSRMEPLLRRIQSNTHHTGKVPVRGGEVVKVRRQLDKLRKELQQAVLAEQFEQAAELRDEIKRLEQRMSQ